MVEWEIILNNITLDLAISVVLMILSIYFCVDTFLNRMKIKKIGSHLEGTISAIDSFKGLDFKEVAEKTIEASERDKLREAIKMKDNGETDFKVSSKLDIPMDKLKLIKRIEKKNSGINSAI